MERPYRPLTSESRRRKLLRNITRIVFYPFLLLAFVPFYGLKIEGRRRLKGPAISVMNHCIYVEWFFLWHAVRPGYIRFTAEQENMQRRDLGWFNYLLGVLGIPDKKPMAIAPAVSSALDRGELVHFFPEGILHPGNQDPRDFMIGAAWFACRHNVPLIPVAEVLLRGRFRQLVPWWPPKVILIVCEPILPENHRKNREKLRDTAKRINDIAERLIREAITERQNQSFTMDIG